MNKKTAIVVTKKSLDIPRSINTKKRAGQMVTPKTNRVVKHPDKCVHETAKLFGRKSATHSS